MQSQAAQNLFLQDAANWLNPSIWGAKLEQGQRYLAAHLASVSLRRGAAGQISEVGAGAARVAYAQTAAKANDPSEYESTTYGMQFKRLMKTLPAARFAVGGGWGFEQYGGFGGALCSTCGNYPCGC